MEVRPNEVHEVLARSMLTEGYPFVLDLERSHGQWLVDAKTGTEYLDFFTFYGSRPLRFDHPRLRGPRFAERVARVAKLKPSNCDIYSTYYAEFVETFRVRATTAPMKHLFFIDGGALAVENALKTAFDWKAQKNLAAGHGEDPGVVLHFRHAFHGRSGYTLSLTNTADPRKTRWFPKFDWPRVSSPAIHFPIDEARVVAAEASALREIDEVYDRFGAHRVACIIIEPIQAEGGDRHFRPRFLDELRRICDQRESLLIFDEVQTGFGGTGRMWAYERLGVTPDVVAFAKKAQTGGIIVGPRIDDVDSVFKVKSRISSTWAGNLIDFLRSTEALEAIHEERLLDNARVQGDALLAGLEQLVASHPDRLSNARGLGLLVAFDAPDTATRDRILKTAQEDRLLVMPCGDRSVRLRPALDVSAADVAAGLELLTRSVARALDSP
ncbi:MAG: L-lysine 6-transaminase [Deltaproteobacteria bacterium]|nr:L-lysine 6-transaminase [Deltaproteobacteria bacterium]